jgi:Rod binding domain-containing protein
MEPIDTTTIPADVRAAGPQAVKLYDAALQFEGLLTQQLTQQMFDSTGADSESSSDSGDDSMVSTDGGPYQSMMPQALSDSITAGGGLGLADELYRAMAMRYGIGTTGSTPTGSTTGEGGEPQ